MFEAIVAVMCHVLGSENDVHMAERGGLGLSVTKSLWV